MKKKPSCWYDHLETLSTRELEVELKKTKRGTRFIGALAMLTLIASLINIYSDPVMIASIGVGFAFLPIFEENRKRLQKIEVEIKKRT